MIDCKTIAADRKRLLKECLASIGHKVNLMVIQVGNDPASVSYVKGKKADCEEVGIGFYPMLYDDMVTTSYILDIIDKANRCSFIHGIIVQLPLPDHLNKELILNAIDTDKDVDGFKPSSRFTPCTPLGIMKILEAEKVNVDGKVCCVIGRGEVGKPMVDLLTKHNATVIWCNSHTDPDELKHLIYISDIVISAAGVPGLIDEVHDNQIVIDVGITRGEDGKLYGDVSKDCYEDDKLITPVPGGVGLMTRVALLENTVNAALGG